MRSRLLRLRPKTDPLKTPPAPFEGLVRSAFALHIAVATAWHHGTRLLDRHDGNDVCIFTRKPVTLKGGHLVLLG